MPGLSLAGGTSTGADAFADRLESLCYFDRYQSELIDSSVDAHIGYTRYPSYPIVTVRGDSLRVVLEGRIYNRDLSERDLVDLGAAVAAEERSGLGEWLRETDGDFVLYVLDERRDRATVLNDLFGRLPMYYLDSGDGYRVSREIRFLLSDRDRVEVDRVGLAQTLLFGYLLGNRTHWQGVEKLPPASVLRAGDGEVTVERLHEFDFGSKRHSDRSVEHNARELAELFVDATRARSGGYPDVVSLSGGHDSRAVAAAFGTEGLPCRTATFARATGDASRDVRIAERVAQSLEIPWDRFEVPPPTTDRAQTLLEIKAGLNHVGMGFILPFFEQLLDAHGPGLTYFTGDGGDKTLPDLSPPRRFSSFEEFVDYVIAKNSVFSVDRAAELAGVTPERLRGSVREVVDSYPETGSADRYVHFLTHERGFNWLFEGEDRNRYYFWSTSPFYSTAFYRYAMNVPDDQKANSRLYQEFFSSLWPPALGFKDADFATPMGSVRYRFVQETRNLLARYPALEDAVRTVYRGELDSSEDSDLQRLLQEQLDTAESSNPVIASARTSVARDGELSGSRHALFTLLTMLGSVESVASGENVFERRPDIVIE